MGLTGDKPFLESWGHVADFVIPNSVSVLINHFLTVGLSEINRLGSIIDTRCSGSTHKNIVGSL